LQNKHQYWKELQRTWRVRVNVFVFWTKYS